MPYWKAEPETLELVREILEAHHKRLDGCKIAVIMREKAATHNGTVVLGCARISPANMRVLFDDDYDFIIELAADKWEILSAEQKRAVVDHELCHCTIKEDKPALLAHDYEEFAVIINRHGLWRGSQSEKNIQMELVNIGFKVGTLK
jgi:predicted metallopeptidase